MIWEQIDLDTDKVLRFCNKNWVLIALANFVFLLYLTNPLFSIVLSASIALHELGHYTVQRIHGYKPKVYVFPIIGAGVSEAYDNNSSEVLKRDIFLAGPTISFLAVSFCLMTGFLLSSNVLIAFSFVFSINGIVNILPISKVDGGRLKDSAKIMYKKGCLHQTYASIYMQGAILIGYITVLLVLLSSYSISEISLIVVRGVNGF